MHRYHLLAAKIAIILCEAAERKQYQQHVKKENNNKYFFITRFHNTQFYVSNQSGMFIIQTAYIDLTTLTYSSRK